MASSVFSLADKPDRGAESSAGMVPSAPRMSPTCASSTAAVRVMEAIMNTPFTSRDLTETGAHAHARPERGRHDQRAEMLGEAACARDRMGQQREGPTSARTIRVHRLPPFHRDARGRQATRLRALLPAGTNRVTPEETNVREKEIPGRTPLVRALALHGVLRPPGSNRSPAASHLASPLRPGRGVLIRSESRRLGSVAYVREDASPNEVSLFQPHSGCPRRR